MKKIYNTPATKDLSYLTGCPVMLDFGVLSGSGAEFGGEFSAPSRDAYNPNGR